MDAYYRKTRRPVGNSSVSLKRPPPKSHTAQLLETSTTTTTATTPSKTTLTTSGERLHHLYDRDDVPQSPPKTPRRPSKQATPVDFATRPTTPTNARITRPVQPPPVKRKLLPEDRRPARRPKLTVRELFKSAHPLSEDNEDDTSNKNDNNMRESPKKQQTTIISSPHKQTKESKSSDDIATKQRQSTAESLGLKKLVLPVTPPATPRKHLDKVERFRQLQKSSPKKQQDPLESPNKIASGPLKGISTSLLDLIRAKEAKVKESPEQLRQRELLGIAPEIARIVPTVFTAHKRDVMSHDVIVDKCFKALRSNYSTLTIIECLELMNKVAPEWVTTVEISRGKFMRLNKDKYTVPQLLEAIKRYKGEKNC